MNKILLIGGPLHGCLADASEVVRGELKIHPDLHGIDAPTQTFNVHGHLVGVVRGLSLNEGLQMLQNDIIRARYVNELPFTSAKGKLFTSHRPGTPGYDQTVHWLRSLIAGINTHQTDPAKT